MVVTKAFISKFKLIPLIACIVWVGKSYPTNPVEVDVVTSTLAGANSQYVPDQGFILTGVSIFQYSTVATG